jgi:hypothetical protein
MAYHTKFKVLLDELQLFEKILKCTCGVEEEKVMVREQKKSIKIKASKL